MDFSIHRVPGTNMRDNCIDAYSEKKRESLTCALIAGCWHGEAGRRLIRSKVFYVSGYANQIRKAYLAFTD